MGRLERMEEPDFVSIKSLRISVFALLLNVCGHILVATAKLKKNKRGVVYAGGSCFPQLGQKVAVASTGAPQFGQYLWPVDAVCGGGGGGGGGP